MTAIAQSQSPFSNLLMELLKLFARQLSEAELLDIKLLLAKHFLEKAMDSADAVWIKNRWTESDARRLSEEHHRTPYKSDRLCA